MTASDTSSKVLLDVLFDDPIVGRCLVAPDGTVLRVNPEWLRSTGFTEDRVLGEDVIALFPDTRDMALAMHARARDGHTVRVPRHAQRVQGRESWWEGSIAPVPMEGGTGLLITAREVGPEPPAGDPNADARDYFRDVGPAGIVLFEPSPPFRVLATNRAYQELWPEPLRSRGLVGLAVADYAPKLEESGIAAIFREVASTGRARTLEEFPYEGLPGGTRWFNWTLAPVIRDGRVVALAHMAVDITREVRARKDAERAAAESRSASEILELGDAFCELDAEYRVVRVNRRQEQLTGVPRERSIGRTHWELWPESAQPGGAWWREYHRCMEERVPVAFENHYALLDLWSSVTAYPTSSGGIAIFFRDASARKRAEQALEERVEEARRRSEELTAMVDAMPAAVFFARDPEARAIDGNALAFEALRLPRGANLSKTAPLGEAPANFRVLWRGVEIPPDQLPMQRAARGIEVRGAEFDLHFEDGDVRCFVGNAAPIRDEAGRTRGTVGAFLDVTELRAAEEQLREADRRKDEFLAVLSHELRNPLAPIRNGVLLLEQAPPGSAPAARAREIIRRQTDHLTRLVDDLLDVTRISRGKIVLQRRRTELGEVVERIAEDFRPLFAEAGVDLAVDLGAAPAPVDADATRLAQVVGNLLQNALKFTAAGGHVELRLGAAGGRAEIAVRDDGIGMEPRTIDRMFEPFAQGDQDLARSRGGLGLGLALVKGLVELHGGRVEARSEGLGRGAEFRLWLPLAAPERSAEPRRAAGAPGPAARSILVIEDNADAAQTLADLLELSGHQVRSARDGRSGVALAREVRPDVVLCDIGLPDLDGYEVARAIRRDDPARAIRLVAVSGYAQPEDRRRAAEAGFDAHLAKPPDIDALMRVVSGER